MSEEAAAEYIRLIKNGLVGSKRDIKKFIASLSDDLNEYLEEHPNVTLEDLIAEFGSPEALSEEFIATYPDKEPFLADVKAKRWALKILIAIAFVVAAVVIFCTVYNLWQREKFREGYFVETISRGEPVYIPDSSIVYY